MDSATRTKMREDMRRHIETDIQPDHLFTFNFGGKDKKGRKPSFIEPERKMIATINALQRKAFGRNWAARNEPPWPVGYGFLEHVETNPHYHFLTRLDPQLAEVARLEGDAIWRKIVPSGQLNVRRLYDPVGMICYCTKDYPFVRGEAALFAYADIRKKWRDS